MSKDKQIFLKDYLGISDDEWQAITSADVRMYKTWGSIKNTQDVKEIERRDIELINKTLINGFDNVKTERIYYPILREVCGRGINNAFRYVEIQIPPIKGKLTINEILLSIRKVKKENITGYDNLDIILAFWLMYSVMSITLSKKEKSRIEELEEIEQRKRDLCLCVSCMGIQEEEFIDILHIVQYIMNDTLSISGCKCERTKFLEKLCSDIIVNTTDMDEGELEQESTFIRYFEAKHTLIYVRTLEEKEVINHIEKVVNKHPEIANNIYQWNTSDGLVSLITGITRENSDSVNMTHYTLEDAIKSISNKLYTHSGLKEIYIFRTIEQGMKDANTISRIKILAEKIRETRANVFLIFLVRDVYIDNTLEKDFYVDMDFYYPKAWRIKEVLNSFIESKNIFVDVSTLDDIVYSCKGLTTVEINSALELAYVSLDKRFDKGLFLQFLQNAKNKVLRNQVCLS